MCAANAIIVTLYIYNVFVSGQRGENVQIVVIYFNRFFLLTQQQAEFQLKLDEHCGICSIDEYAGSCLISGRLCVAGWESARDNAPMCGQVVRTAELSYDQSIYRPTSFTMAANLTLTGLTQPRTSLT